VTVSTVVPARDAEAYLGEAIESVLNQTLPVAEVIVVDDGSTDATAHIADGFGNPVRCVRQAASGVGAALNRGVEEASGALLAFLDADDLWTAEKNEIQVRALSGNGALDMVFGHVRHFYSPELRAAERERLVLPVGLAPGFLKGTMLVRREAFRRVGDFATQWRTGDFVDWYARALDAGLTGAMLPDAVLSRRLHRNNTGVQTPAVSGDYVRVLKAILDRRRTGAN
jgi:glycosyltransferase involved in cell wall biosynthesis